MIPVELNINQERKKLPGVERGKKEQLTGDAKNAQNESWLEINPSPNRKKVSPRRDR